ncbi:uncharacterized protein LOC123542619 isoform X2 [Mercenaria mercenaria]|uniref:uncharacterized protein LOC123542619 isoform X2 n=1 Tax=Mercenaria mercenaria TaxID=6596 RepID=UPI00234ED4FD|nr:uncharacterized protein LOC123542619 isoform X2 [Mercenaria mercenaria]
MVSPPTTPGKSLNPKYPLFNKLLHESLAGRVPARNSKYPACPATAPVLTPSYGITSEKADMDKEIDNNKTDKHQIEEEPPSAEPPIKLMDPPKTKLKRQLSIDTAERTDAERVRKRAALLYQPGFSDDRPSRKDEVDGGRPSTSTEIIHTEASKSYSSGIYETGSATIPITIATSSIRGQPELVYDTQDLQEEYTKEYVPLPSPNRFNLSDIGLTSPFATRTSFGTHEKEAFVFPDNVPPRKISPYKNIHEEYRERDVSEPREDYSMEMLSRLAHESIFRKEYKTENNQSKSHIDIKDETQSKYSRGHHTQHRPGHVSERGFAWPEKATITEPVPFSPRIVTTDSRPRFPTSSTSNDRAKLAQEDLELKDRLRLLEREYARAKEIYGSPPVSQEFRQMSPTSRNVESLRRGALRSISNKDRSPNEKEIREISDDVRSRYERSFSDPRFSPRQIYSLIMRPSPLCRQYDETMQDTLSHDRCPDRWRDDVKRRLFVKGDLSYSNEYRRQHSSAYHQPATNKSAEIPEEVLQFLHSRNFHPEELENLKDVLRRGGSPIGEEEGSFPRLTQGQFDTSREIYARYRHDGTSGRRDSNFDEDYARTLPRERHYGDIDVRLTCESIKEKSKKTEELLNELEHDNKDCKCAQIEQEIRLMAMDAYSKIRRANRSAEAHDQFQNELNETNAIVYTSMRRLCGIKCLCKYGRTIEEVFSGSVVFRINCPNVDALLDLWQLYKSGDLLKQFKDAFINEDLLEKYDCEDIILKVEIRWQDYLDCKQELESPIIRTPTKSPLTPVHTRSRSEPASVSKQANQVLQPKTTLSPFRERFCSDSSVELSPRRAFQELNAGKHPVHPPPSPSKKYISDNVFTDEESRSPLTSPRRKTTFVFKPQNEQENVEAGDAYIV